jgi:hypothetical protein
MNHSNYFKFIDDLEDTFYERKIDSSLFKLI